ncbi:hypothetical protein CTRI78_v012038 [Colletotrichum trifolii]|uniref:GDS1 winged helix domain-containing protein n=1 Tax=Colletotrichum trifolii TaxID=5466 RepID=A0A4R8PRL9_COLTR|nr:hypothetical protein CTRI78_v012038 [Colletotrichum trifolii]
MRFDDQALSEHPPPPSPKSSQKLQAKGGGTTHPQKIDSDHIDDEIVEAVIVQLQATANRPHLVKELATILSQRLSTVQQSANPAAIISSRLAAYLKRSTWNASRPCPLARELETVHPRRTYFYLSMCPRRQAFTDSSASSFLRRFVLSPSLPSTTSGSDDGDGADSRRRDLSPSPEVDLSSPEFDDVDDDIAMPTTPGGSLPNCFRYIRTHLSASPPLEKDEREFTRTADVLQKRKLARELSFTGCAEHSVGAACETARDEAMFDEKQGGFPSTTFGSIHFLASPAFKATQPAGKKDAEGESWFKLGTLPEWDRSPENIELDELDGLLDSC